MITLIAKLIIKEGKMDEAVALLKEIAPGIRKNEAGCLAYIPHTVKGEDNAIIIYEKYRDKDALKIHSTNLPKTLEKLFPLLDPGLDIKTCFSILDE